MTFDRKASLSDPELIAALRAHVRSRVSASDADDVLQAVLADALASAAAPDEAQALRRWLFGVARNKIADHYRRARRELPSEDVGADAPESAHESIKDLLRWAEKELPPDSDAKRTFEWMLREGEGEKLESIALSEKVPAPRVRQRVSRLRRHFRERWAAYAAALAAAGLAILVLYMLRKKPEPVVRIVPEPPSSVTSPAPHDEPIELAKKEREHALERCDAARAGEGAGAWRGCLLGLDLAARLDPASDSDPRVVAARAEALKALTPPPAPTPSAVPTVAPTSVPTVVPLPTFTSTPPAPRPTATGRPSLGSGSGP